MDSQNQTNQTKHATDTHTYATPNGYIYNPPAVQTECVPHCTHNEVKRMLIARFGFRLVAANPPFDAPRERALTVVEPPNGAPAKPIARAMSQTFASESMRVLAHPNWRALEWLHFREAS